MGSEPIFLTGFSGTGKTTVGKALAFQMGRIFFDVDQELELLSGKSIEALFADETQFRKLESQILSSLAMTSESVVALGGGALLSFANQRTVADAGYVVYLESGVERLKENLRNQKLARPLLKDLSDERIQKLFEEREPGYKSSHQEVKTDGLSVSEICHQIVAGYEKWTKKQI